MAIEAYLPQQATLGEQSLENASVVALYDPDGPAPAGALAGVALNVGATGPLELVGMREGRRWRVRAAIEVVAQSAVGCEFRICGEFERAPIDADEDRS